MSFTVGLSKYNTLVARWNVNTDQLYDVSYSLIKSPVLQIWLTTYNSPDTKILLTAFNGTRERLFQNLKSIAKYPDETQPRDIVAV